MRDPPDGFACVNAYVLSIRIDDPTKRICPWNVVGYTRGHEISVMSRIDDVVFIKECDVFRGDEPWERTVHAMPIPSVRTDVFREGEPHDGMSIIVFGTRDRIDGLAVFFAAGADPMLDTGSSRGLHAVDPLP